MKEFKGITKDKFTTDDWEYILDSMKGAKEILDAGVEENSPPFLDGVSLSFFTKKNLGKLEDILNRTRGNVGFDSEKNNKVNIPDLTVDNINNIPLSNFSDIQIAKFQKVILDAEGWKDKNPNSINVNPFTDDTTETFKPDFIVKSIINGVTNHTPITFISDNSWHIINNMTNLIISKMAKETVEDEGIKITGTVGGSSGRVLPRDDWGRVEEYDSISNRPAGYEDTDIAGNYDKRTQSGKGFLMSY